MTRHGVLYWRTMFEIHRRLGDKCDICGTTLELEIDHQDGRAWEPRRLSSHMRAKRYLAELDAGIRLRLLCKKDNGTDGNRRKNQRREGR